MPRYITQLGDMWDVISKKVYETENHTDILINANPQHASIVIFPAGINLHVPEVEKGTQFIDLPPWKRG